MYQGFAFFLEKTQKGKIMNEEETQAPVASTTDTQETEQKNVATPQSEVNQENAEQKSLAKTEEERKSEQSAPTTTEDKPAETKPADTHPTTPAEPKTDPATPVKPNPTPTTPEQPKKLADFLPGEGTNLVRISGDIAGHHFDCSPVTEIPFKITKARWPFVPAFIEPNPNYEFQTFNYDVEGGQWIPIDSKSQGQILTDLNDKVKKIDKVAEQQVTQNQTLSAQQTKLFMNLTQTVNKLTDKVDQLGEKDGNK